MSCHDSNLSITATSFFGSPLITSNRRRNAQEAQGLRIGSDFFSGLMGIGNRILSQISFVTPVNVGKSVPVRGEDGLLPTMLFHSVFISNADHYAIFDPK